jgi:hypothetical protein
VFVSGAAVRDGVGVSGVWAPVLVGSGTLVGLGLAENWAIMNAGRAAAVTTQPKPQRLK